MTHAHQAFCPPFGDSRPLLRVSATSKAGMSNLEENQIMIAIRTAVFRATESNKQFVSRGGSWSTSRLEKVINVMHANHRIIPDDLLPGTNLLNTVEQIRERGTMESVKLEKISSKTVDCRDDENSKKSTKGCVEPFHGPNGDETESVHHAERIPFNQLRIGIGTTVATTRHIIAL